MKTQQKRLGSQCFVLFLCFTTNTCNRLEDEINDSRFLMIYNTTKKATETFHADAFLCLRGCVFGTWKGSRNSFNSPACVFFILFFDDWDAQLLVFCSPQWRILGWKWIKFNLLRQDLISFSKKCPAAIKPLDLQAANEEPLLGYKRKIQNIKEELKPQNWFSFIKFCS